MKSRSSTTKVAIDFSEICSRLRRLDLPEVDEVVGIANGGVVPASLVAFHLGLPLSMMRISYRDRNNIPKTSSPELVRAPQLKAESKRFLLVDDVSVTGSTLAFAKRQLPGDSTYTLVIKGQADFVLFPEIDSCVLWPW